MREFSKASPLSRRLRMELLEDRCLLAVITVNSLLDNTTADGQVTLREALLAANGDTVADAVEGSQSGSGADRIEFAPSLFENGPASLVLTKGELLIASDVHIVGPGDSLLSIDASGNDSTPGVADGGGSRAVHVRGNQGSKANVTLHGFHVTGGDMDGTSGGIEAIETGGAGILIEYARVTLIDMRVTDNVVVGPTYFKNAGGGVRSVNSDLRVINSRISRNETSHGGGGIFFEAGDFEMVGSTIAENRTRIFSPAGIELNESTFHIENSRITNNEDGSFEITSSTGTILTLTIAQNGGDQNSHDAGIRINSSTVEIRDSSITESGLYANGTPNGWVPGIWAWRSEVTAVNSTIAKNGVGIIAENASRVHVIHSTIAHNVTATKDKAGGIRVLDTSVVTLDHSLVADNMYRASTYSIVAAPDVTGSIEANFSLIENPGAVTLLGTDNIIGVDARLGILGNYGGPTRVVPLLDASPAIDAGSSTATAAGEFDQRQAPFARSFDGDGDGVHRRDIGAFEKQTLSRVQPFVVDNARDELDGDYSENDLSLREAIGLSLSGMTSNEIRFAPSLSGRTILLELGNLTISGDISIDARSLANGLTLDGGGDYQSFNPHNFYRYDESALIVVSELSEGEVDATIAGLTLRGSVGTVYGAIRSFGNLRLEEMLITENAAYYGSAINMESLASTLKLVNCRIDDNWSVSGSTIVASGGSLTVQDSRIENNRAAAGGGLWVKAVTSLLVDSTTIANNISEGFGGGIFSDGYRGHVSVVRNSSLTDNQAAAGGGIYSRGTPFRIENTEFVGNQSDTQGGAVFIETTDLEILGSTFAWNEAATQGGAIYFEMLCSSNKSELSVSQSTITNNSAGEQGGGIYFTGLNASKHYQQCPGSTPLGADLTIDHSTIVDNTLVNSTGAGAGIYFDHYRDSTFALDHSILASNRNAAGVVDDYHVFLLLSGETLDDISYSDSLVSEVPPAGLVSTRVQVVADPKLGPLRDNGGPTRSRIPLFGSRAIDAGEPNIPDAPHFDQRGFPFERIAGVRIDIGAIEFGATSADFDNDGDIDGVDFLVWQRGVGKSTPVHGDGDADLDGDVDAGDSSIWEATYGQSAGLFDFGVTSADFDNDGDVDGIDFLAWQRGFNGLMPTHGDGDADFDGDTDARDLSIWEATYGQGDSPPQVSMDSSQDSDVGFVQATKAVDVGATTEQMNFATVLTMEIERIEKVELITPTEDFVEAEPPIDNDIVFSRPAPQAGPSRAAEVCVEELDFSEPSVEPWLADDLLEKVFS